MAASASAATLAGQGLRSMVTVGHPRDPVIAEWFGGARTAAGVSVTPGNSMRQSTVYACVGLLADTIASLPFGIYQRDTEDGQSRAADHPLDYLLHDRPNDEQTSIVWRQDIVCHLALRGNSYNYVEIDQATGAVTELLPLHPDQVTPFRFIDSLGKKRIGYQYRPLAGNVVTFTDSEIIHIRRRPFSADGLRGTSPIDLHRQTIGEAIAAQDYGSAFYGNNATPKGAIKLSGKVDKEAKDALREDWDRRHRGPENAHRLAILDLGMEYAAIGMTNDQAQYIETRAFHREDIAMIFGIPPHMIGSIGKHASQGGGNGIEQQSIGFVVYNIRPWLVLIEQAFTQFLILPRERRKYFAEHNVAGLLRGDFKTRMDGYALMIQWGIASPNEIRRLENLPPVTGGEQRLVPLNMAPADQHAAVIAAMGTVKGTAQ